MRVSLNAWIYYHGCRNLSSIIFRFSEKFSEISSTSVPDASEIPGTLPRAKKVSTGHFFNLASLGPPFRVPAGVLKNPDTRMGIWIFWYAGRDSFTFSPLWGENYGVAAVETGGKQ